MNTHKNLVNDDRRAACMQWRRAMQVVALLRSAHLSKLFERLLKWADRSKAKAMQVAMQVARMRARQGSVF